MEGVGTDGDSPEGKSSIHPYSFPGPARFKAPQSHLTGSLEMRVVATDRE